MIIFALVILSLIAVIGAFCIPSAETIEAQAMGAVVTIIAMAFITLIVTR